MSTSPGLTDNVGLPWENDRCDFYVEDVAADERLHPGPNAYGVPFMTATDLG